MSPGAKVLITGARGQLGAALVASAPPGAGLVAVDRSTLDITDRGAVADFVARHRPRLIINAAAYTAVDQAEAEPAAARRVNADGAAHLAEAAHRHGARLFQISTDYVFDGTKATPYTPQDPPNPLSVYGATKLAGERAAAERTEGAALIVRTAWVYAKAGRNFVNTMLRLLRERDEVRVVCDQVGTPTHAAGLARALWRFAALPEARGIHHWTDAGVASWYDFAVAIRDEAALLGLPIQAQSIVPISSAEYRTAARRPAFGVLDKSATWAVTGPASHWQVELRSCLSEPHGVGEPVKP